VFAILGLLLDWQIDSLFVTAMLTVIGFSTHDTIVIFDRIRENLKHRARGETFAEVADRSIDQTFARSINTSLTTALVLIALLVLGGPVIRVFVAALLLGVILGTYSSIFNAAPLLVLWRHLSGDRMSLAPAGAGAPVTVPPVRPAPKAVSKTPEGVKTPSSKPKPAVSEKPPAADQGAATAEGDAADDSGAARSRAKRRKRRM